MAVNIRRTKKKLKETTSASSMKDECDVFNDA